MTYIIRIFGKDEKIMGKKRLADTRIQACKLAKKIPGYRVCIYDPSKMFSHPIEDITYYYNERTVTGLLNGYYLHQWDKNRTRKVSPTSGAVVDYSKEWKGV